MAAKDPNLYLLHIREACERVLGYTAELGARWPESPLVLDAVCRNLEIMGEAAESSIWLSCRRIATFRGAALSTHGTF